MGGNGAPARVWLITGCSTGIGREIALAALAKGERVVVTARNPETVEDIVEGKGDRALAHALDVTRRRPDRRCRERDT